MMSSRLNGDIMRKLAVFMIAKKIVLFVPILLTSLFIAACGQGDIPPVVKTDDYTKSFYFVKGNDLSAGNDTLIVVVHGLFGDAESTWGSSAENFFTKLNADERFKGKFDAFSFGYPTNLGSGSFRLDEAAGKLESALDTIEANANYRQIILVGHSMGGLVIMEALTTSEKIRLKTGLVVNFATPHTGSEIANAARNLVKSPSLPGLISVDSGNGMLGSLRNRWQSLKAEGALPNVYCAYEKVPYQFVGMIVTETSSTALCDGPSKAIDANHVGIVKPSTEDSFDVLVNWVKPYIYFGDLEILRESSPKEVTDALQESSTEDSNQDKLFREIYALKKVERWSGTVRGLPRDRGASCHVYLQPSVTLELDKTACRLRKGDVIEYSGMLAGHFYDMTIKMGEYSLIPPPNDPELPVLGQGAWVYGGGNGIAKLEQDGADVRIWLTWKPKISANRPAPHYLLEVVLSKSTVAPWKFDGKWSGPSNGTIAGRVMSEDRLIIDEVSNEGEENLSGLEMRRYLGNPGDKETTPSSEKFPIYVTPDMVVDCFTRNGDGVSKCSYPGIKATLGGQNYDQGVVFTQSMPQTAFATIRVPKGARSFAFTVGNYWTGGDCGGQSSMQMKISVDGASRWANDVSSIRSDEVAIPPDSRFIELRGESGDGDGRCDDSVWAAARFR